MDSQKSSIDLAEWIDAHHSDDLNEWETNFLIGVLERIEKGFALSFKQFDKLTDIYERVTSL